MSAASSQRNKSALHEEQMNSSSKLRDPAEFDPYKSAIRRNSIQVADNASDDSNLIIDTRDIPDPRNKRAKTLMAKHKPSKYADYSYKRKSFK